MHTCCAGCDRACTASQDGAEHITRRWSPLVRVSFRCAGAAAILFVPVVTAHVSPLSVVWIVVAMLAVQVHPSKCHYCDECSWIFTCVCMCVVKGLRGHFWRTQVSARRDSAGLASDVARPVLVR